MRFIETREALRDHYKAPSDRAVRKELGALDGHCRAFIEKSPFVLIGSSDGAGNGDVTPKGDRPGFVAVLDETTLAIPDRPGNNRLDTLENLIANSAVGLLFLTPGMTATWRVTGRARITAAAALSALLAVAGKKPATVMIVSVRACYMHCAKAFLRSALWDPQSWPARSAMPTLGQILTDQLAMTTPADHTDRALEEGYRKTMW
ncbi:MAG: pyridoxamine 5'-phosphate oxidase family protein [Parvibaculum sp.]